MAASSRPARARRMAAVASADAMVAPSRLAPAGTMVAAVTVDVEVAAVIVSAAVAGIAIATAPDASRWSLPTPDARTRSPIGRTVAGIRGGWSSAR